MQDNQIPADLDKTLEEAFKIVDADVLKKLREYLEAALAPILLKSTPEQRVKVAEAVNKYMSCESEDPEVHLQFNNDIDFEVRQLVELELDVKDGQAFDDFADQVCDAIDTAVEETAIYGQMKGHEMMGEILGVASTGPARVEDGKLRVEDQ